jgi:predicted DNA-binding protein (UPF0251 family)
MAKNEEKLTKVELAKKMGISRPTLDKYLREGFPQQGDEQAIKMMKKIDLGRRQIEIENAIRLHNYEITQLQAELVVVNEMLAEFKEGNNE